MSARFAVHDSGAGTFTVWDRDVLVATFLRAGDAIQWAIDRTGSAAVALGSGAVGTSRRFEWTGEARI